jgi:hypothetical protein
MHANIGTAVRISEDRLDSRPSDFFSAIEP